MTATEITGAVTCPECGSPMVLRETKRFTYKNGTPRKFYGCSQWPKCAATHGAHPSGEPLGVPADAKTKRLRIEAHQAFDQLWKSGMMSRDKAYRVMQKVMGMTEDEAHIGRFTKDQCLLLIVRLAQQFPDLLP